MKTNRRRCACGRLVYSAYGFYCRSCEGLRAKKHQPSPVRKVTPEIQAWADQLDRNKEVSYREAAEVWGIPLIPDAVERVNQLVCTDTLRATGKVGRFRWTGPDEL